MFSTFSQTIFYELPRLSCLSSEEWISAGFLSSQKYSVKGKILELPVKSNILFYNHDTLLSDSKPPTWVLKIAGLSLSIKEFKIFTVVFVINGYGAICRLLNFSQSARRSK